MHVLAAYVHRLDPIAIPITESFGIHWYGLAYAAGFVLGWLILRWFAKTGRSPMTVRQAGDIMTAVILGVLIGGRLGWAIFYQRGVPIWTFGPAFPYWELLAIGRGGMASHGGMIGVIIAVWWFARRHGLSRLHLMDLGAFGCCPGLFLGRLANFVNGELWGHPLPARLQADPPWWGIRYPEEVVQAPVLPPETIDALREHVPDGPRFLEHVAAAVRAGDETVSNLVVPHLTAHWPSQFFQAITDGPVLMGLLVLVWLRPRKPGVVGAVWLIAYGVLRVITERFRQPDEGVALLAGLTRGQVLSIVMIVSGVVAVIICSRRDAPKYGGLLRRA